MNSEQQRALDCVVQERKNIFLTGPAGTGKSFTLHEIIKAIRKNPFRKVFVTASTGIAAQNIQGQTLHAWAGLGLAREKVPDLVRRVRKNNNTLRRWKRTDVFIIDEVSMVSVNFLQVLNSVAKEILRSKNSQGQTLRTLDVDLSGNFAPGMVYVALSRGVSLDSMIVRGLEKEMIKHVRKH